MCAILLVIMVHEYRKQTDMQMNMKTEQLVKCMPFFAEKFFNHLIDTNKSALTRIQYAYDMKRFFDWYHMQAGFSDADNFNALTAEQIFGRLTVEDIQEYTRRLRTFDASGKRRQSPYAVTSLARKMSSLRSFIEYYHHIGELSSGIASLIEVPQIPDAMQDTLSADQAHRLLAAISDISRMSERQKKSHALTEKRDYAMICLLLGTGLRVSELVGIDMTDIDFEDESIKVVRKGGGEDKVFLTPQLEAILADYISNGRNCLTSDNNPSPALFLSLAHSRITARSVELIVKKYGAEAGINVKLTPHTLRRTFGTNVYNRTGDIYLVADALHHSSVATTTKHYARGSEEHKRRAVQAADNLLNSSDKEKR